MRKLIIKSFDPTYPKIFKIGAVDEGNHFVIRIDILHKAAFIIYRKRAYFKWLEEISYEYK